jgi:hypothetical protein
MPSELTLDFRNLPPAKVRRLDALVNTIRPEFHEIVEQIRAKTDHSVFWQVNNLLSRNNYICSVFYHLCCLALVLDMEEAGETPTRILVQDTSLKQTLETYYQSRRMPPSVVCTAPVAVRVKQILKPAYDMIRNIHWSLIYLRARDERRQRRIPRKVPITLVDTFFSGYIFKSGAFKERYYTGVNTLLAPGEKGRIFFVPNVISWRNLEKMVAMAEKADENFLYPFDFLKLKDYLIACLAPFFIRRIDLGQFRFRGIPIGALLKSDFRTHIALRSSFRGILFYLFFRRLNQENVKLHRVVDWFENQVVDRGFNLGKNEFYPDTPSIGYQGLIAAYNWNFHVQPTRAEAMDKSLPQQVAVIGTGLADIARRFYPELDVVVAPGMRFSDIHKTCVKPPDRFHPDAPVILVALPIWVEDSLDILGLVTQILPYLAARNARVVVKPHPSLDLDQVRAGLEAWPHEFEVGEGPFPKLVLDADLLISTGSTVCMESLAYGVPVIVIGSPKHVTKNIIPETVPKGIWDLCFNAEELREALDRLCFDLDNGDYENLIRLARKIRSDFFTPVSRKRVCDFLGLED